MKIKNKSFLKKIKWISIIVIFLIAATAVTLFTIRKISDNKVLSTINKLVENQYFDKGTYDEFINLYQNPKKVVVKKVAYDAFRKAYTPKQIFQYDYKTPEDVMKHMKVVRKNNTTKVYYLININDNDLKNKPYWEMVKKNNKWLIKN